MERQREFRELCEEAATAEGMRQFFLAGVHFGEGDGEIHFLVAEGEGREGAKISEIVLKSLLPSRPAFCGRSAGAARSRLFRITPTEFEHARGARIACLGLKGIEFWRLQE